MKTHFWKEFKFDYFNKQFQQCVFIFLNIIFSFELFKTLFIDNDEEHLFHAMITIIVIMLYYIIMVQHDQIEKRKKDSLP